MLKVYIDGFKRDNKWDNDFYLPIYPSKLDMTFEYVCASVTTPSGKNLASRKTWNTELNTRVTLLIYNLKLC